MNKKLSAVAIVLSALTLHTAASANLVRNGSFEDVSPVAGVQTQTPGTWSIYSAIDGWSATSGSGIEVRNSVVGTASTGSNFVELDANNNSSMAQTILTAVGAYYTLSFDYSPRVGVAASSNGIDVLWNGALLNPSLITASGVGLANHAWNNFSFGVFGTGNDMLSFRSVGTNDALGGSLDNVRLVPEPGVLASFLVGLMALGFVFKARRCIG